MRKRPRTRHSLQGMSLQGSTFPNQFPLLRSPSSQNSIPSGKYSTYEPLADVFQSNHTTVINNLVKDCYSKDGLQRRGNMKVDQQKAEQKSRFAQRGRGKDGVPPNTLCSFCEVSPGILTLFWQSFIDVVSFCTLFESGQGMREIGIH